MPYTYRYLKEEQNYAFRKRLAQLHRPDRRDARVTCGAEEMEIREGWSILVLEGCSPVILNAAKDLQDYLLTSMGVSVLLKIEKEPEKAACGGDSILLLQDEGPALPTNGFRLCCTERGIRITGATPLAAAQGSYYLEDLMNRKEAPVLQRQDTVRAPAFSPRMVHSGWGMDQFPDSQLRLMAHYGFDSVVLTLRGIDETAGGYRDIQDIIDRAAQYGLGVYFYSNIPSEMHPDDAGAEEYYESIYGKIFARYPQAKGLILVGESIEFPSRDPHTTGKIRSIPGTEAAEWEFPDKRPSPGWWPCSDYPQYIGLLKRVVRRHCPQADIVFWTYNWGWAPEEARVALLRALPEDITVMVTFEMFERLRHEGITNVTVDYTLSFEGPGKYFTSEAEAVHARGMRLYTMSNAAGLTWDFGVIPYEPAPFQWARRYRALMDAHERYGLCGTVDAHHFGWWPSVICEMAKWSLWEPETPLEELAAQLARRDYGAAAAPSVLDCWRKWSEAMTFYIPTDEDQYGPFRIGPSYPLILQVSKLGSKNLKLPQSKFALTGNGIFYTLYQPFEFAHQTPGFCRTDTELRSLEKMRALWESGTDTLEQAMPEIPERKREEGERLLNLGRFMLCCIRTAIHVKRWYLLNMRLRNAPEPEIAAALCEELIGLGRAELTNTREAIPLVTVDSRLGWEPSMEYMTDRAHLEWKLEQLRRVVEEELPELIEKLRETTDM